MIRNIHSTIRGVLYAPLNRGRPVAALSRFAAWQIRARLFGGGVVPFVNGARLHVRPGMRGATGNVYRIDVEGFEDAVIGGAERLLRQTPPLAVIMEVGQGARFGFDDWELSRRMVEDFGYRPCTYDPFTRALRPKEIKSNVIYVRQGVEERLRSAPPFRVWNQLV